MQTLPNEEVPVFVTRRGMATAILLAAFINFWAIFTFAHLRILPADTKGISGSSLESIATQRSRPAANW